MNETEHLLTVLTEECAEVGQRACKALRFGLSEIQPGQPEDNKRRLERELADLMATAELLGLTVRGEDKAAKREKLKKYMDYSREIGTLEKKKRSIEINEDDGCCPKCGLERKGYRGLFHHPDGGDEEAVVICESCGEKFTILRRVIVAEYSVKEKYE
jgi:DNA-directed RNA polymerase subunit M/transcription elongation factor TFIIS